MSNRRATADLDRHIGWKLRARRKVLGLTLDEVAGALGVSLQQVQKYERGVSTISAAALWRAAVLLRTPVGSFFEPGS